IISLENVVQILKWGRLVAKRCPSTGRVVTLDMVPDASGRMVHRVANPGERVPVEQQYLVPDPKQQGKHWHRLVAILRGMGYIVEWRELNAADYGAGTTRTRLFMMARRDGQPIVWPTATHFKNPGKAQRQRRAAADGIDWTIEGKSIFNRPRPLADATMRRIARGMKRYVLDSADPFIVPIANWSRDGSHAASQPISTITAKPRGGSHAVVAPVLAGVGGRAGQSQPRSADEPHYTITRKGDSAIMAPVLVQAGYGERDGQAPRCLDHQQPLGTITAGGIKHAVATGFMVQANGGFNATPAHDLRRPASTITNSGSQQQLITAHLVTNTSGHPGRGADDAMPTITTGGHHGVVAAHLATLRHHSTGAELADSLGTMAAAGQHHALVEYDLSPEHEAGALQVAAFL
ncbi:DNA cytosine methyltransferase, partial [Achromobacter sp. 2789STDY5608628]|uniref:DNA cytosine methyltransferase n=1 Tax=Achromobacter sp. 2789STDY5608628 TaxID=1806493 RepID=UPI000B26A958